jgi:hypothetical protein
MKYGHVEVKASNSTQWCDEDDVLRVRKRRKLMTLEDFKTRDTSRRHVTSRDHGGTALDGQRSRRRPQATRPVGGSPLKQRVGHP